MEESIILFVDGLRLKGVLHMPDVEKPPVVIGSHGLFSTKDSPKQVALAGALNKRGIAYFRFDHRGCGESDGEFKSVTSFDARKNDLSAAIRAMTAHPKTGKRIGLFGSSMGGAACLGVGGEHDIAALVVLAARVRLSSIRVTEATLSDTRIEGMTPEQMEFDITEGLDKISNIMIFHGDADTVVPIENAFEIMERVREPKRIIQLSGADHPISDPALMERFIGLAVEWFESRIL